MMPTKNQKQTTSATDNDADLVEEATDNTADLAEEATENNAQARISSYHMHMSAM